MSYVVMKVSISRSMKWQESLFVHLKMYRQRWQCLWPRFNHFSVVSISSRLILHMQVIHYGRIYVRLLAINWNFLFTDCPIGVCKCVFLLPCRNFCKNTFLKTSRWSRPRTCCAATVAIATVLDRNYIFVTSLFGRPVEWESDRFPIY